MAITNVSEYAHLSQADLDALAVALEAIRRDIEDSRGEKDRTYIQRTIAFQRCLDVAARLVIVETQSAGPAALARYQDTLRDLVPALRRGRSFRRDGETLPRSLETSVLGGVTWVLHERLVASRLEPSAELHAELFKILAGPYLGEAQTKRVLASL